MVNKKIILLVILLLCCSCGYESKNSSYDLDSNIKKIISYDEEYSYDFLKYIYNEYGKDALEKISNAYNEGTYDSKLWHGVTGYSYIVLNDLYNKEYDNGRVKIVNGKKDVNISFVGDISLADNFDIMPYYDSRGKGVYGILSTEVVDIMKSNDIMVANNEFAITNSNNKINKLYNFKGKPERLNIYKEMGIDLVSTANNHVYDYGEEGLIDTIKYLNEYDIPNVGAGSNIDEASSAYYFIAGGYKISFLSATRAEKNVVTPNATKDKAGTFWAYDPSLLIKRIKEEKEKSDYVVLLIHWGREDSHDLEDVQIETGKLYIDAGADLIIGAHAHVLQGFEIYNNKLIAYNLGDFIFNSETKDNGILNVTIDKEGNMVYKFIPCKQDNYYTDLVYDDNKIEIINKLRNFSINVNISDDGEIYSK